MKVILIILILAFIFNLIMEKTSSNNTVKFGVSFSPNYAGYLKLDWQETYIKILDELQVKKLRIPGYWEVLEPEPNQYDFSQIDFMLNEADKRNAKVLLVLGIKQPRWPECHIPDWARELPVGERRQKALEFIEKIVKRYKENPAIEAWQVENEPLLEFFGEGCDAPNKEFLKKEAELVRSLSNKKIIMSDSGELGFWSSSMQYSDIFGTTLYRKVYDRNFGYISYPLPPYFYSLKSNLVRNIFAKNNEKTIILELQAEPWLSEGVFRTPDEQTELFTINEFKNYTDYAQKTGFDEAYLWGVEWWYFASQNGQPQYLDYAKTLF